MRTLNFNGQQLPAWLVIKTTPIQASAPIKRNYRTAANRHGSKPGKPYFDSRPLPFGVEILADSHEDLHVKLETLGNLLYSEEPAALTYSEEPGRTYYATWDNQDEFNKDAADTAEGTLGFICPFPFKEGAAETEALATTLTFPVPGNFETPPIFTVNFSAAATNYKIANQEGLYMEIKGSFFAGDQLIIDHQAGTVTYNGADFMPAATLLSRWFKLQPGSNTLTITTTAGAQQTNLAYKPRYK